MMKNRRLKFPALLFLAATAVLLLIYLLYLTAFAGRFFPGVKVAGVSLGGQAPATASHVFQDQLTGRTDQPIKLTFQEQTYTLNIADSRPQVDLQDKLASAYLLGRSGNFWQDLRLQLQALVWGVNFPLAVSFGREDILDNQIKQISLLTRKNPVSARLSMGEEITVVPARDGEELNEALLKKELTDYLTFSASLPEILPTKVAPAPFSTAAAQRAKAALDKIKISPVKLHFQSQSFTIDQAALLNLLDLNHPTEGQNSRLLLDSGKLAAFLKDLAAKIDQPTRDAKFTFDNTSQRVEEFQPETEGRKLDTDKTAALITQALGEGAVKEITLPVEVTRPKVNASAINSFGIKELLGEGVSHFAGSIENRIYNIGLAASRINGTLIPPGETFSFNNTVGDISSASGYKQAYVIKSGRTVLDDGGGVCQVSTTLFRAILNSGLPVVERTAHAYRVAYYEQGFSPGLDATVFAPTVDFKFKNDTPAYVLVQAHTVGTTLLVDLFGTGDGRVAKLSTPSVTNQTPPPEDLRQDDPTLPKGTVKQVDWSAWGANVSFKRTVTRGGETLISETFKSYFKPWQAVFLVGTKE